MASASTIRRLHFVGGDLAASATTSDQAPQLRPLIGAREMPVRGRFVLGRAEPAGYSLTPEIMSPLGDIAPLDRSFQFAAMAERERLQAVAQRYLAARGMHGR
jgi:hypothetical protein